MRFICDQNDQGRMNIFFVHLKKLSRPKKAIQCGYAGEWDYNKKKTLLCRAFFCYIIKGYEMLPHEHVEHIIQGRVPKTWCFHGGSSD